MPVIDPAAEVYLVLQTLVISSTGQPAVRNRPGHAPTQLTDRKANNWDVGRDIPAIPFKGISPVYGRWAVLDGGGRPHLLVEFRKQKALGASTSPVGP